MSTNPVEELKNLHGWTARQIIEAVAAERQREDVPTYEAILRILERVRAGKPTYAQLEARVAELETELEALKAAIAAAEVSR